VKKIKILTKMSLVEKAEAALKAASAEVIEEHKQLGLPLVLWRDGKVVDVPPAELEVKEPKAKCRVSSKRKS
jgi:hypothetical protein